MASNNDMSKGTMIQKLTTRVEQMEAEINELRLIKSLTTRVELLEAELRELQCHEKYEGMLQQPQCHQLQPNFEGLPSTLANASPTEQKTILCGYLYPLVEQIEGKAAAKVTEMILWMDVHEVLHLLESPQALEAKVEEAMEFLQLS